MGWFYYAMLLASCGIASYALHRYIRRTKDKPLGWIDLFLVFVELIIAIRLAIYG